MAKTDKRLDIDYWHKKNVSIDELQKVHRALAKRSNQRLVRLERSVSKITGESYASYGAGDIAKEYLSGKGRKRFSESGKMPDRVEMLKDISTMQKFLNSQSSTVKGQKAIEKKRIESFTKPKTVYIDGEEITVREPIEFATNKEFYDFLSSETFKEMSKSFNSETIVESYDKARQEGKSHDEIMKALEEYRERENQSVKGLRQQLGLKELT